METIVEIKSEKNRKARSAISQKLVIMLHGVGSNAEDLISLVDYLGINQYTSYVSPNAPEAYDRAPVGFQWFSLQDYSEAALYKELQRAAPVLEKYIAQKAVEYNLSYSDIVILGFSQGSMMALYTAPRLKEPVAGVVAISGALVKPGSLENEAKVKPSILLIHGDMDQIVPFEAFKKASLALKSQGFPTEEFVMQMMGHSISSEALLKIKNFLISKGCS